MGDAATINLPLASSVDELLGNRTANGETDVVRISIANLSAQSEALRGPSYELKSELDADLDWIDGAEARVWGDPVLANRGIYKKSGGVGEGTWTQIGPLPETDLSHSLRVPDSETITPFPDAATRAGTVAMFDVEGNPTAGPTATDIANAQQNAQDAQEARDFVAGYVNTQMSFDTKAAAAATEIVAGVHAVRLAGSLSVGDGDGGLFIDTDTGSADTFVSTGATSRTWYRAADLGSDRFVASAVRFEHLSETAIDWLSAFSVSGGNDAATNDANLATLEGVLSGRLVDMGFRHIPVSQEPTGNQYDNGFFKIANYEGAADASIPVGKTLPRVKFDLTNLPAYITWAQDSGDEWLGMKTFLATVAANHGESFKHQVCWFYCNGLTWTKVDLWGPGAASELGYWCSAGRINKGVQFAAIRAQNSALTTDNTYELHRWHLGAWLSGTDVIRTVSTSSSEFRIDRADLDLRVSEGDIVNIPGPINVGGLTISGDYPVAAVFETTVAFTNGGANATSVEKGGGFVNLRINQAKPSEVTFVGGYSLGEALYNHSGADLLTGEPVAVHDMVFLDGENSGSAWVGISGGGFNVGAARLGKLERGANEAVVDQLLHFDNAEATWSEPTLCVNPDNQSEVFVFCRAQSNFVGPGFGVSTDGLATEPTWDEGPAGWATKNPIACFCKEGYIIAQTTGNRGDTLPYTGHKDVPVFLLIAKIEDAKVNGWAAFERIVIDFVDYYDHSTDDGPLSVSPIGVGTIINTRGGAELIYGGSRSPALPLKPTATIHGMKLDLRAWTKEKVIPDLDPESCPAQSGAYIEYQHAAAVTNGIWKPAKRIHDDMPGCYDPATGVFTVPETRAYAIEAMVLWNGVANEQYLEVVNPSSGTAITGLFAEERTPYLAWSEFPVGSDLMGAGKLTATLTAGTQIAAKATGTTVSSTVRNVLRITAL